MKKLILGLALLTFTVATNAQDGFTKGSKFLTGGIGISSENDKDADTKTSSFSIAPSAGYFITDNLAVGIGVGFGSEKLTISGDTEDETSVMKVGGFGRYYFSPKNKFTMFGHLGINYASLNYKTVGGVSADAKVNGIEAFVSPGFNYWISNKLALEALIGRIGYSSSKPDVDGAKGTSTFDFGLDLTSVSFGINYKF